MFEEQSCLTTRRCDSEPLNDDCNDFAPECARTWSNVCTGMLAATFDSASVLDLDAGQKSVGRQLHSNTVVSVEAFVQQRHRKCFYQSRSHSTSYSTSRSFYDAPLKG